MNPDSFNYFYNLLQIPEENFAFFYDFSSGNANNLPSIPLGNSPYSGISNLGDATGLFSGQNIAVQKSNRLYSPSWTTFVIFEKTTKNNGILFSNLMGNTNNVISGYCIGVNSANKLYVESYDENGPKLFELDVNLASKNAVAISKNYNNLTLSYFDFNSKLVTANDFNISSNSFLQSDNWNIGNNLNSPSYFSGQPFIGYMDAFIHITGTIFPYEVDTLFSGFTISNPPQYNYTVTSESCNYSNIGLTGQLSGVVFNNLDQISYGIQTGYLLNQTGILTAITSGTVVNGSGNISGNITGYIKSGIPFSSINTGFYTQTNPLIASGLRIFETNLPSGSNNIYIPFPNIFTSNPIVITEINDNGNLIPNTISGVSTSGFNIIFADNLNSNNFSVNVMSILPQDNYDFKCDSLSLNQDSNNQFVLFNSPFTGIPKVFCQIGNDSLDPYIPYQISGVNASGFNIILSEEIDTTNYYLNYIASDLKLEQSFQINSVNLGNFNNQFISFTQNFASPPIVLGELNNNSGNSIIYHQISGVSTSGFTLLLSDNLNSPYSFNYIAWSGFQSGIGFTGINGLNLINVGKFSDEVKNVYDISGYAMSTMYLPYEISINRTGTFTGMSLYYSSGVNLVNQNINTGISYTINFGNTENSTFTYTAIYNNQGSNFITVNNTLKYFDTGIQSSPFYVYKNCNQLMGLVLSDYTYDTGYIFEFGMEGVSYIGEANSLDFSELNVFPLSHNKNNININILTDKTTNSYILPDIFSLNDVNLYENGVALLGENYSITGNIYNSAIQINGDYGISGNYALPANIPDTTDIITLDNITNTRINYIVPQNYVSGNLINNTGYINSDFYLNGVQLNSGVDYTNSGNYLIINSSLTGISGNLFSLPNDSEVYNIYTGNFSHLETPKFARNTSILSANGVRQIINKDYLETAKVSLLEGNITQIINNNVVFNNDSLFWE